MDVSLVMFKADGTRRDFHVTKEVTVIGRTSTCDLRIPLAAVSRQHSEIRVQGNAVKLRDLGSSNGTMHNAVRIQEVTLQPGDEVTIGPVVFKVVIDGQPEKIEPVRTILNDEAQPMMDGAVDHPPAGEDDDALEALPVAEEEGEEEVYSPTVDLDDDPIATLEQMDRRSPAEDDDDLPMLRDEDQA